MICVALHPKTGVNYLVIVGHTPHEFQSRTKQHHHFLLPPKRDSVFRFVPTNAMAQLSRTTSFPPFHQSWRVMRYGDRPLTHPTLVLLSCTQNLGSREVEGGKH